MKFLKERLLEDKKITVLLDEVAEGELQLTAGCSLAAVFGFSFTKLPVLKLTVLNQIFFLSYICPGVFC